MPEEDIVTALERAVLGAPDDLHLRLHLAALLIDAGRSGDALAHCRVVLGRDPGHQKAAELARRAGEAAGSQGGSPE